MLQWIKANNETIYLGATTVGHNFASQQQAGHTSHPSQSRHGSTHQRYVEVKNMSFI